MNMKMLAICIYIMFIYWVSLQYSFFDTLFFPTLGAFSFLFVTRSFNRAELSKITFGAVLSSIIGTVLFYIYPSVISIFINVVICFWMINKFKWNAPPIVAVALIPFFSHTSHLWAIPLSVCGALLGLIAVLYAADRIEKKYSQFVPFVMKKRDVMQDSE